ncbi:MAG TPA: hypothetical protein VLH09_10645, partial [Bryobacteraceae bacterium]|nr:hypothetical protein [Bryobacteraceae bacterium]
LAILLHVGAYNGFVDAGAVAGMLTQAITPPRRRPAKAPKVETRQPSMLDAFLSSPPTLPVLSALLQSHGAHVDEVGVFADERAHCHAEVARLQGELKEARTAEGALMESLATLRDDLATSEAARQDLQVQLVTLDDGYRHKLSEMRGRLRGVLEGQLTRWLETALDASRSDPPWIQAVEERLEDALALIGREGKWLQPLG